MDHCRYEIPKIRVEKKNESNYQYIRVAFGSIGPIFPRVQV